MSVRRRAARLATVCVFLGGLVMLGGAPAQADEDRVRVRSAGSFTAGRSAGDVRLEVRKRTDGCVRVRGALGLSLPGIRPEQVAVQMEVDRRWVSVPVSGADGLVTTAPVAPAKDELCKRKGVTIRYRVAFGADAPGGRLVVTGEAVTARGVVLGRAVAESRVAGGRVAPSPSQSRSPSPSPTPDEVSVEPPVATPTVALAADTAGDLSQSAEQSGGVSPVMYAGIAMVAAGALLIGLLVHRSRKDRRRRGEPVDVPLGNPGGTTYRSARSPRPTSPGPEVVPPAAPGQVYGTGRPPTPRVYGGPPAARPTGGLYGARSAGSGEQTRAMPTEASGGSAAVPPSTAPPGPGVPSQRQDPAAGEDGEPRYGGGLPG
ncbi:hypothetical protein AB0M35_02015 [Micromonospora sp. NPDC051196]|uniref:hypothetical protein n=1 Tax=Micromonospora sp. NPDC051196 TaxID=3155281 RepID=UPI003423F6AE